jgi:DNA-binding NarL/FixJ family response regulator
MVRVMIVDDEALVRSGLRLILSSAGDIEVVATCEGVHAVEEVRRHQPDVLLLDLRMPQVDGLTVLRQLAEWPLHPAVAMLTTFDSDEFIAQALSGGAAGFLLKDTEPDQLLTAVRTLAAGGSVLSPAVTRTVINGYIDGSAHPADVARIKAMSQREREVLRLIGLGLSNADIGRHMHLSTATVKDYVSAVLVRLGVANRVQAAIVAHEVGIPAAVQAESGGNR